MRYNGLHSLLLRLYRYMFPFFFLFLFAEEERGGVGGCFEKLNDSLAYSLVILLYEFLIGKEFIIGKYVKIVFKFTDFAFRLAVLRKCGSLGMFL